MATPRVAVIGAGTIGSLLAGHLGDGLRGQRAHAPRRARAGRCASTGCASAASTSCARARSRRPTASELPDFDVGIFACKALDLDATAARLAGRCPQATMMTVQNGLGAEEVVARHGAWPLISAVTFMSGIRHSDWHVEYELDTATWMGPWARTATPVRGRRRSWPS